MEFEITHVTHYRYTQPAAEAYGEARLTPPTLPSQTVLSHRLLIDPEVKTSEYHDHFGNRVDFFSLPFRHRKLVVSNQAIVRTHPVERPQHALDLCIHEARQILNSSLTDIFDYLIDWFAGSARANITGSVPTVQDIFAFLQRWFAPC